jgi:hypothetical protein
MRIDDHPGYTIDAEGRSEIAVRLVRPSPSPSSHPEGPIIAPAPSEGFSLTA